MMTGPVVCRRCAVISRGITGHCNCALQLVASKDRKIAQLEKKMADLNEVLIPFVFHAKALKALTRKDRSFVVSQAGNSYLVVGAYQSLLEAVDKKYFGHKLKT